MRRSIVLLSVYNALIYIPLILICISARAVMPNLNQSDEVIPRMALWATSDLWGGSFIAGLILAAPFGAVMATVSTYLVVIASGLVRDIYQRFINPQASDARIRRLSHIVMVLVGAIAVGANIYPVAYLQAIVVFSGTCGAAAFVVPGLMACFWRRATASGVIAAMLAGVGAVLALFFAGWLSSWLGHDPLMGQRTSFRAYFLLGFEPIFWGLIASGVVGVLVTLATVPPDEERVSRFFDAQPTKKTAEQVLATSPSPAP